MNNLDHSKNFYPDNYKLDLSETMKAALSKGVPNTASGSVPGTGVGSMLAPPGGGGVGGTGGGGSHNSDPGNSNITGTGYVTEKLYMLLQLYLQNKGWNPSAELLQCFSDLKDNAMLPSAAYLQVLASRLTLDAQGRLILRDNGKIVLPYEHFANAVMLKHMSGPHGLHLSVDATVRAVMESYTIGRENFGMEKDFIFEVVQSCPNAPCRYYKNHIGISPLPFMDQQFSGVNPAEFLQHMPHLPPPPPPTHITHVSGTGGSSNSGSVGGSGSVTAAGSGPSSTGSNSSGANTSTGGGGGVGGEVDLSAKSHTSHSKVSSQMQHLTKQQQSSIQSQLSQINAVAAAAAAKQQQQQQQQHHQQQQQQAAVAAAAQQHLTAALIQQQNRALAQQSLEKFSSLNALEKQRVLSQLDPKHFDPATMAVAAAAAANLQMQGLMQSQAAAAVAAAANAGHNTGTQSSSSNATLGMPATQSGNTLSGTSGNHHNVVHHQLPPPPQSPTTTTHIPRYDLTGTASINSVEQMVQKSVETLRSNLESLESNKDLLALHNGAWASTNHHHDVNNSNFSVGQDKIVRIFSELMRNMARMKTYIRPSMCKPYGKQSESLQKTLIDTVQIIQTLRSCLPAPHIPVTSWKSESEGTTSNLISGVVGGNIGITGGIGSVSNLSSNVTNSLVSGNAAGLLVGPLTAGNRIEGLGN